MYTEQEWDDIGSVTDEEDKLEYDSIIPSRISAYVCPDCGRIMVFQVGPDGRYEDRFRSYAPEGPEKN